MYFKSVELFGFKSFADRTVVNLESGTTAIVGPNGCGKSNILDALRWCLGEQSAKALRGSHMQDVIFNGSEQRPPMGMAEVTLTFDNADNTLPLDFADVQVTRRVYRSGESEYLINKAPCRLRDVQELFMDTGIGTNAYSLIGQGKIDLVLSSKPEDRRFLFEEAAGIIKYKSRKRVAMRKLESADQNLLRLGDIVAEVQRQMRTLKRQVTAAIRHRELTDALRELEIRNAWLQYNELSGQVADLKERFDASTDHYEKVSAETSILDARLAELNIKRIELERMLMARRDGEHEVDSEMEKIESQIALIRKEIEFAQQQQEQAAREHEEFTKRTTELGETHGAIDAQSVALHEELAAAQQALTELQAAYDAAGRAVRDADLQVDLLRKTTMDTLTTRNRVQTELETLGASLASIDGQLEGIFGQQQNQTTRLEDLSTRLQDNQRLESEKQKLLTESVEQRRAAQEQRTALMTKMEAMNKEWQDLREKRGREEARLNSLRELRDSYEGFAIGVRAVMKAKQQNMPEADGVIGPVGDLLSTDKEYGQAIEAALGGNVNNIVVKHADSAKQAIAFLKKHNAGRVTFLPLDTIRSGGRDDLDTLRGAPGVVGPAINYVQCDRAIMPAVEYLLFNTVIVKTIDDAIRIARSERRFPRLVTLDGEVVSSAGAVTGGRTRGENQGLLGRSAEIDDLEKSVATAEKRLAQITGEAAALTQTLQELSSRIKSLTDSEETYRGEVSHFGVIVAKLSTELDSLSKSGQELGSQRDELQARRKALQEQRDAAQTRIVTMEGDDETLQQQLIDAQDAASQARQSASGLGDQLADLRVKVAELSKGLEEAERSKVREQQEQGRLASEASRRLKLIEDLKVRVKDLEHGIADQVERAAALSETKEQAHGKVVEVQKEQHQVIEESKKITDDLKKLREQATAAQKEVHKLELDLTQKEDRIKFFQERIASEYGLALGSLTEKDVGSDDLDEGEREKLIQQNRKELQRLGTVNLMAIEEYEALEKRDAFLTSQEEDLRKAREALMEVVKKIDETIKAMFMVTFNMVAENFKNFFRRLFNGGQARVYLVDENDPLECGIEIEARPPGKKPQTISLLSGGEQAMTAIALLFSIFSAKPSPFCVLDEVDAPLDDANIGRFLDMVGDFVAQSQFIIITHSKQTMGRADALFGVTQQERGVSQLVSVKLDEFHPEPVA
jgi:chromosome segregation protein